MDNTKTTIAISEPADAVLDAVISSLETPLIKIKKRGFASEHLIQSLWDKVPADKKPHLLRKHPSIRTIISEKA